MQAQRCSWMPPVGRDFDKLGFTGLEICAKQGKPTITINTEFYHSLVICHVSSFWTASSAALRAIGWVLVASGIGSVPAALHSFASALPSERDPSPLGIENLKSGREGHGHLLDSYTQPGVALRWKV